MSTDDVQTWTDDDLVEGLCELEDGLSEWEVEFVDSIAKSLLRYPLTPKQRAKAEDIWRNKGT